MAQTVHQPTPSPPVKPKRLKHVGTEIYEKRNRLKKNERMREYMRRYRAKLKAASAARAGGDDDAS